MSQGPQARDVQSQPSTAARGPLRPVQPRNAFRELLVPLLEQLVELLFAQHSVILFFSFLFSRLLLFLLGEGELLARAFVGIR